MSLLVVGSVAFDAIETPFGKTDKIIGGSGTFISLSASNFTKNTSLVAVVGNDFLKEDIKMLQNHGIDTEGLQIKEDEKSFFWAGRYHNDMNTRDTLVTELNVLGTFDPIIPEKYQKCEYLILGNLSPQVQKTVINRMHK
ncbi:MAG: sugar kinase, partial [Bacteroidota bacterium]|nr:sugar kinase [Bacteroidota bacterium]